MSDHLRAVVEWAQSKYTQPWQRDALRRVVEQSVVTDADRGELVAIIEAAAGAGAGAGGPTPRFLALPSSEPTAVGEVGAATGAAAAQPIVLGRLHSVKHVNALAPGQEITFAEKGLTLIYGENGAGKTGYSRILRRACRQWREKDIKPILPSVKTGAPTGTPEATFDIREGTAAQPRSVKWSSTTAAPAELSGFAVFDGSCVRPLIGEENVICYLPRELTILPTFASVLTAIEKTISAGIAALRTRPASIPNAAPGSSVASYVARLDSTATLDELDRLVADVPALEARHSAIATDLALLAGKDGPESQAQALERMASRVDNFRNQLSSLANATLGDANIQKISDAERDFRTKKAAAERASQQQFKEGFLPGTGMAEEWKQLYRAAKAFSEQAAYPGKAFPVFDPGSQCPWCQQAIDAAAAQRLRGFHAFVEERTATEAARAQTDLETLLKTVRPEIQDLPAEFRDEVRARNASLDTDLDAVGAELRARRDYVVKCGESGNWSTAPKADATTRSLAALATLSTTLKAEAAEKRKLVDPAKKKAIEAERDDVTAKIALAKARPEIVQFIANRSKAQALQKALGECGTTALSTQNGEFSKLFITRELAEKLNEELRLLGVEQGHLAVEFKTKTEKGITRNSLILTGTTVNSKDMHEVLSEGEQRVLAIAAFISELRMASAPVGVIFDDPVTSLDHRWVDRIADRLARLGEDRQVIIFTHHISFSYWVRRHAERMQTVPLHEQFVRRICLVPGHVGSEPLWEFMPVKERRQSLDAELAAAKAAHTADPDGAEYTRCAGTLVDHLRSTWEQTVEEVLFNKTVRRFEPEVMTNSLREVEVNDDDFKTIFEAMTLLSAFTPAHSKAAGHVVRKPSPDDLRAEIDKLYGYVKTVRARKEDLKKQREAATTAPARPAIMPKVGTSAA